MWLVFVKGSQPDALAADQLPDGPGVQAHVPAESHVQLTGARRAGPTLRVPGGASVRGRCFMLADFMKPAGAWRPLQPPNETRLSAGNPRKK